MTGANNRHMLLREEHARSEAEDSLALSLRYAMRLEGRRETQDMAGLRQSKDIPSSLDVAATARNAPPILPSESIAFHNSEEKPSPLFTRECLGSCSALSLSRSLREDLCEKKISPLPPSREGGVFMSLLEWGEGGHGGWERRKKERRKKGGEEGKGLVLLQRQRFYGRYWDEKTVQRHEGETSE